jgi:hypothetical protein
MLDVSPEALDAIDVVGAKSKLMVAVMDAMMPRVTDIDQAVIAQPTIVSNRRANPLAAFHLNNSSVTISRLVATSPGEAINTFNTFA